MSCVQAGWPYVGLTFCLVTVRLGLLTREIKTTTIVFSVDILPGTTQMQELCDIPYCKSEETTSSDCS